MASCVLTVNPSHTQSPLLPPSTQSRTPDIVKLPLPPALAARLPQPIRLGADGRQALGHGEGASLDAEPAEVGVEAAVAVCV